MHGGSVQTGYSVINKAVLNFNTFITETIIPHMMRCRRRTCKCERTSSEYRDGNNSNGMRYRNICT